MKRTIILLAFFLASTTAVKAQRLKANTIINAKHSSFRSQINQFGTMNVENTKNTLSKQRPKNQRFDINSTRISGVAIAFKQVFSEARLKELLPEYNMFVSYMVSPEGKVLEVSFLLKPQTMVTADELEALEASLKKNASFKLSWMGNNKQEANFVSISQAVQYRRILDGTLEDK
ncbi:MAG TPA: hypothetical protein VL442_13425 [Mucilaginibacter sp.]|jgi:hypothetical protein|nr:hypothetical protein [Mucilaginibacter sp.]